MENSDNNEMKSKKRQFKQTRELIRLALNNGWTQTEIAKTCRTQQSVVSAWSKGEKRGTEQQLSPLLELFGHKLRRSSFKLYQMIGGDEKIQYVKVEGQIIFNLTIHDEEKQYNKKPKLLPKFRIIVHYQNNDRFVLLILKKSLVLNDVNLENATWFVMFKDIISSKGLINFSDNLHKLDNKEHEIFQPKYKHYFYSCPFLIRQALLNRGIEVENIEILPSSW